MLMCPYCSSFPDAAVAGRAARRMTPDLLRGGVRGLAATLACAGSKLLSSLSLRPGCTHAHPDFKSQGYHWACVRITETCVIDVPIESWQGTLYVLQAYHDVTPRRQGTPQTYYPVANSQPALQVLIFDYGMQWKPSACF